MRLSLIIPCYNEAANIPLLLERCRGLLETPGIEVLLVDNGSIDDTPKVLQDLLPKYPGCRTIRVEKNLGYGFGILSGLLAAKGEIIAWTHADMQTDPQDVLQGLKFFNKYGNEIFVKGRRAGRPLGDVFFTIAMSVFETLLLRKPLWDINAQPTMFSRAFFENWSKNAPYDFSLDLYAYYKARQANLEVYRFPVNFGRRAYGVSHWNINWKEKWKFIKRTVSFSFQLQKDIKNK